ncbi:CHASE2 domain-containing protein [Phormidium sp. CLA17]|uniref:CHASE2 domain-containing protein n=1 Tax=Leptolyngbya sp. Cla-17 TaxID=2803751 RepID=UPI001490AE35|nr:CHASE2 domain-containing protein [Leptolyngbya sp. Cla-17]MBM0740877.1 CHASE2 domain-containing protein [Leptolyngbya sp. Cla-17]
MAKLVVLKIIDGSFEQGFTVMQEIGEDNQRPSSITVGKLPPLPEMPLYYSRWKESYWRLESRYRITVKKGQRPNVSVLDDCDNASKMLRARLNTWLLAEDYRSIREQWLKLLSPEDEIRILIQTEDSQMRALPWNLLEFLEDYPNAEVALSALNLEPLQQRNCAPKSCVNILSIVGNSDGIDTNVDQVLLDQLPQTYIERLIAPDRKILTDQLWNTAWDILFFAGHSTSQDGKGRIFLNKTDSLTMGELKYALQKSVANGLQLAVFNSCDGLDIARELAELNIPQIIVMREPVPDLVAQEFLEYFLSDYAQGKSLYLAVRAARERLQGMEDRFPCATWLPLICQNPTVFPPMWQDFLQPEPPQAPTRASMPAHRSLAIALLTSFAAAALVGVVRFFGLLQPIELAAFDHLMRLRPPEPPDSRLLVVAIDDEDLRQQSQQEDLKGSISDQNLTKLLDLLTKHQPRAIGLDLYFHRYANQGTPQQLALTAQFRNNENLISICKVGYDKANPYGIAPPPDIPPKSFRVGFSDFMVDGDEVVRRHLLGMNSQLQSESRCQVLTAFSIELALRYLYTDLESAETGFFPPAGNETFKIRLKQRSKDWIAVPHGYTALSKPMDEVIFPSLPLRLGGYQGQGLDGKGSQILLNYRAGNDLRSIATQKSLSWFLSQDNPPSTQELNQLIRGKVVLIGVTAREKDDYHKTPYGNTLDDRVPGVFIHAHMLSQLLSAVLDGRPLLWAWSPWGDWAWIASWSSIGGLLAWGALRSSSSKAPLWPVVVLGVSLGVLYAVCAGCLMVLAVWMPLVPSGLGLLIAGSGVTVLSRISDRSLQ